MAGFFGLFDYSKPGRGVEKDEPKKGRFLHFWELFFRKFWRLIQLNLLYILFCLPVVTIGPATAGMTYVLRNMASEQPVFLFSDFWDAFRQNWKQSVIYSLLMLFCSAGAVLSAQFYTANADVYKWMYLPAALTFFVGLMLVLMSFYAMLMIVTLDLPLSAILKNAFILGIVCLKTNLLTLLFTGLLLLACFLFLPYSVPFILLIVPAWVGFIICYNSYPGVQKYAIDPHAARQREESPPSFEEDAVFRDEEPPENQ